LEKTKQRKLPKIVVTRASDESLVQIDGVEIFNMEVKKLKKRRFKIMNRGSEDSATK